MKINAINTIPFSRDISHLDSWKTYRNLRRPTQYRLIPSSSRKHVAVIDSEIISVYEIQDKELQEKYCCPNPFDILFSTQIFSLSESGRHLSFLEDDQVVTVDISLGSSLVQKCQGGTRLVGIHGYKEDSLITLDEKGGLHCFSLVEENAHFRLGSIGYQLHCEKEPLGAYELCSIQVDPKNDVLFLLVGQTKKEEMGKMIGYDLLNGQTTFEHAVVAAPDGSALSYLEKTQSLLLLNAKGELIFYDAQEGRPEKHLEKVTTCVSPVDLYVCGSTISIKDDYDICLFDREGNRLGSLDDTHFSFMVGCDHQYYRTIDQQGLHCYEKVHSFRPLKEYNHDSEIYDVAYSQDLGGIHFSDLPVTYLKNNFSEEFLWPLDQAEVTELKSNNTSCLRKAISPYKTSDLELVAEMKSDRLVIRNRKGEDQLVFAMDQEVSLERAIPFFTPDNRFFALINNSSGSLKIWDLHRKAQLQDLPLEVEIENESPLAFSSTAPLAICRVHSFGDPSVGLLDLNTGRILFKKEVDLAQVETKSCAYVFHPSGHFILISSIKSIEQLDLEGQTVKRWISPSSRGSYPTAKSIYFLSGEDYFLTMDSYRGRIWSFAREDCLGEEDALHYFEKFTPIGGNRLVAWDKKRISLFSTSFECCPQKFEPEATPQWHQREVMSYAQERAAHEPQGKAPSNPSRKNNQVHHPEAGVFDLSSPEARKNALFCCDHFLPGNKCNALAGQPMPCGPCKGTFSSCHNPESLKISVQTFIGTRPVK